MAHPLFRKQIMEMNAWLLLDRRNGKRRTAGKMIGLALLWIFVFLSLGSMFFMMFSSACEPLMTAGFTWIYQVLVILLALVLGLFGSVFNVSSSVYQAKDNDALLAMPLKPWKIVAARLLSVWLWILVYEAIVMVPGFIILYRTAFAHGLLTVPMVLCNAGLFFVVSFLILAMACLLGFVVAKVNQKIKGNSMVKVFLSLAFIAAYYFGYYKASILLQKLIANADVLGGKIKGSAYPLYLIGTAGTGDGQSLLLVAIGVLLIFALVWIMMVMNFVKMTIHTSARKRRTVSLKMQERSVLRALTWKERKRFFSSSVYMLNSGMSTFIIPVLGIFMLIKGNLLLDEFAKLDAVLPGISTPIMIGAMCMMASLNELSAPSVSLEGKNVWILQSLPVDIWKVLKGKILFHYQITALPVLFLSGCMAIVVKPAWYYVVFLLLLPQLYILLTACFGLLLNLKFPVMNWSNEVVPIKQSTSAVISMFGSAFFLVIVAGIYFLLHRYVPVLGFLGIMSALILILIFLFSSWIKKKGVKIFERL